MFDKEKFSLLLERALGDRTATEYSNQSGVNRTYISKFLNKRVDNPPSPDILKRLADTAHNGVTYTELMEAAGYMSEQRMDRDNPINEKYKEEIEALDEFRQIMIDKGFDYEDKTYEELAEIIVKHIKIQDLLNNSNNKSN